MTTPAQYATHYARLKTWVVNAQDDAVQVDAPVINYLQDNMGAGTKEQAMRAKAALKTLQNAVAADLKWRGTPPTTFKIGEDTYLWPSIQRTYMGKASPAEIQETLWLSSVMGVLAAGDVPNHCRNACGIDCGGFVANYWGRARPTIAAPRPTGWDGMKPRYFWETGRAQRRRRIEDIRQGDAVIFFAGKVFNNDPSTPAKQKADKSYDRTTGTEAFHIGLFEEMTTGGNAIVSLRVADSAGSPSAFAGSGVNVKTIPVLSTTVQNGLVGCAISTDTRLYFVGPGDPIAPQLPQWD